MWRYLHYFSCFAFQMFFLSFFHLDAPIDQPLILFSLSCFPVNQREKSLSTCILFDFNINTLKQWRSILLHGPNRRGLSLFLCSETKSPETILNNDKCQVKGVQTSGAAKVLYGSHRGSKNKGVKIQRREFA